MNFQLINLQVNGYKGVSFTSIQLTEENCRYAIKQYLFDTKCWKFLPTVITTSEEVYKHVLPILHKVSEEFKEQIPGFHLEGPFISRKCKGAHDDQYITEIHTGNLDKLRELSGNKIKIITVASELFNIDKLINYCKKYNIKVSLGHQNSTVSDIQKASDYGASLLTHLGNGISQKIDRHDNAIIGGLVCDDLTAMIIPDGFHLPDYFIKLIIKVKGIDKVICVSDISPLGGLKAGEYSGRDIGMNNIVRLEENGKLHIPSLNCLAGSSMNILQCAQYLFSNNIVTYEEIKKMFYINPMKILHN